MSEHVLTTLKPVVLANDDFQDSEQTFVKKEYTDYNFNMSQETSVKEVYTPASSFECGQRYVSEQHINVSARNMVNVTSENVADLFDDITYQSSVKLSSVYHLDDFIQLYKDLPKDLFQSGILSDNNSDERQLKHLRRKLFSELKAFEFIPFAPGTNLKRRKNNNRGEGAVMKLCGDIYVLTSILDGAPFDNLKQLDKFFQVFITK